MERLILSVDRLDYSKGLRQRFAAFERFLAEFPAQHGLVTFMQIAPVSRGEIAQYRALRREIEGLARDRVSQARQGHVRQGDAQVEVVEIAALRELLDRDG